MNRLANKFVGWRFRFLVNRLIYKKISFKRLRERGIYYYYYYYYYYYFLWLCSAARVMASSFMRFRDTTRHATVGRTPLDE
jgi:hypothetical protein